MEGKKQGSLTLTNKRLTFGATGSTILLKDIKNVELETRTTDVTKIKIEFGYSTGYIGFVRHTGGHMLQLLVGSLAFAHSEVSSYTAYWASLITMATFMFGETEKEEPRKTPVSKDRPIGWGIRG